VLFRSNLNVSIEGTDYVVSAAPTASTVPAPVSTDAKSDIERRKDYSLNELGVTVNDTGEIRGLYISNKLDSQGQPILESITGNTVEEVTKKIEDKYEAELAVQGQPTTKPTMSIDQLQAAADSTSQTSTTKTPINQAFSQADQQQAKDNADACKTGVTRPSQVTPSKTPNLRKRK
jgi:hypothetical protein